MSGILQMLRRASYDGGGAAGPPMEVSLLSGYTSGASGPNSTITRSGQSFGTANANRWILFASVGLRYQLTSITIGGVAAEIYRDVTFTGTPGVAGLQKMTIAAARVPTGTSGSIVQNFNVSGPTVQNFSGWVFRVISETDPIVMSEGHQWFSQSGSPQSISLAYPVFPGALAIGLLYNNFASSYTMTGTENHDLQWDATPRRYCFWEVPTELKNYTPLYTMSTGASGANGLYMTGISLR